MHKGPVAGGSRGSSRNWEKKSVVRGQRITVRVVSNETREVGRG